MILKWLGRGSAFNIKEGNTSAYIKQNNELFLIDCGENIFERILNKKLLDDVDGVNVLITHLNSDHVGSLSSLIYYCYYIKNIKINVIHPNQELFDLLRLMGHEENKEYNKVMLNDVEDNYVNSHIVENINCCYAKHINTMTCYSYVLFLKNEKCIYYSGDNSEISFVRGDEDWINEFYQDTCLVDYEGNVHMSLKKLCDSVPRRYRHRFYCMHLDNAEIIDRARQEGFNVIEVD